MPYINVLQQQESDKQDEVAAETPAQEESTQQQPEKDKPQLSAQQQALVKEFKTYLKQNGWYNGDVNDLNYDDEFVNALKEIERFLSQSLQSIGSASNSAQGLIWQGNQINPQTSVKDVQAGLDLIKKAFHMKKSAQATVDTFDPEEETPLVGKFVITQDESKIQSGDHAYSQQTGELQQELPSNFMKDMSPAAKAKLFRQMKLRKMLG